MCDAIKATTSDYITQVKTDPVEPRLQVNWGSSLSILIVLESIYQISRSEVFISVIYDLKW